MFRQNMCCLENLVISLYPHKINMGNLEASGAEPRWSRAKSFLSAPLGTKIHLCTKFQVFTFYGFCWAVLSQLVTKSPLFKMGTLEASLAEPRWSRAKSFLSAPLGTKIH